jgi:hypothetical protein
MSPPSQTGSRHAAYAKVIDPENCDITGNIQKGRTSNSGIHARIITLSTHFPTYRS